MEIIPRFPIIYVTLLTISGFNNVIYDRRENSIVVIIYHHVYART